ERPPMPEGLSPVAQRVYGAGDWRGWEDVPAIAVVGSRHISEAGYKRTVAMTAGLSAGGMAIVSGGAVGGDTAAIEATLACGGLCVSVQACGLDVNYPTENEALRRRLLDRGGVLLSEYPLGVKPGRGTFQVRNRLISGLALGTLVTEAQTRSGTLITAHCARDQGRDVFAVPGDEVLCGGCHRLIREGALLVTSAADVLAEYLPQYAAKLNLEAARAAEQDMRRRYQPEDAGLPAEPPAPKSRKPKRAAKRSRHRLPHRVCRASARRCRRGFRRSRSECTARWR
ncbi:MAG: DNA-protecting protein DprA, partial [Clostridia bacterium]|nr:DNA-protecting protein DprA [Clostridia bacterium]